MQKTRHKTRVVKKVMTVEKGLKINSETLILKLFNLTVQNETAKKAFLIFSNTKTI